MLPSPALEGELNGKPFDLVWFGFISLTRARDQTKAFVVTPQQSHLLLNTTIMANSPKNKSRKSTGKNGKEVVEQHEEENASGEEDEEGYEVESILEAKWQYSKRGKWSYFVRWKGYGPEDDLWIDEDDAAGAEDLINDFHETNNLPRDGKGKKGPVKKPRASATSKATQDKKRKAAASEEMEVDSPEVEEPPSKKQSRRGRPSKAKSPPEPEAEPDVDEEPELASIDDFMKITRWDDVIKQIETVEKSDDDLIALFTRQDGQKSKCSTAILAERCPQLLITFYETHLKWRPTDDD
ncbi:Chromo shadow domain containing protein [Ceratobasidium theobromae]|uniref:Chromo shadow domain containing protein n=1 Tax=Ceratobasidium theobromae TaxID=1582974 RepID=A0A5N5QSR8_9AGAM|nr:Chromo shadow domain containing protein [Ceratobasidium theobromae]